MNYAIILAGGNGKRFGSKTPKQFIEVNGKPILAYTIEIFENNDQIDFIEIVGHRNWIDKIKLMVDKYQYKKVKKICNGGDTFLLSAKQGVYNLSGLAKSNDILCFSFGCSPLTPNEDINDSIRVAKKYGNGVATKNITLCTCVKDDEYSSTKNILRETLAGFANPWSFRFDELFNLFNEAEKLNILDKIEQHTTSLYFAFHKKIYFSKSTSSQVKITTKDDLNYFKYVSGIKNDAKV